MTQTNVIGWCEIAVSDMDRAKKFYETVFDTTLEKQPMEGMEMWAFPMFPEGPSAGGALIKHDMFTPCNKGTVVYFNSTDIDAEITRIGENGGTVIVPKKSIGEHGFIALFIDTEGNRIGLHSMK